MIGLIVGLMISGLLILATVILIVIWWLANKNIFFTIVKEAEAKAIMRSGKFERFVYSLKGYALDADWNIKKDSKKTNPKKLQKIKDFILAIFAKIKFLNPLKGVEWLGIYWVGIPPFFNVYRYDITYSSRIQVEKDGQAVFIAKKQTVNVDSVFLRDDVFVSTINGPETYEKIPIDVEYILVARSVNPYKTLFQVQHWLEAVHGLIEQAGRDYVGTRTYDQLVKEESTDKVDIEGLCLWLNKVGVTKRLESQYGIKISSIDITSIKTIGELGKSFVEATTREYVAKQEAKRKIEEAKGEAKAIALVSKAIKDGGDAGVLAVQTRTLTDMSKGEATKIVIPASVTDALERFSKGGKP